MVDYQWHEIADSLPRIESLMDDDQFPEKQLAASVASRVFYQMEEHEDALRLALEAGQKFDLNEKSQYVDKMIHQCIDQYIRKRVQIYEKHEDDVVIDPKMEDVVNRMFERCFQDGEYR